MDPHLVAALVSGGLGLVSGAGLLRRRVVVRAIEARRRAFVEGLPSFGRSAAQGALVATLDRYGTIRDDLAALASAAPHIDLPRLDGHAKGPEEELLALAAHFVQDARNSLGLVCDARQARTLLEADPGIFAALHERGTEAFASRASVAALRTRVSERHAASQARLARLASASRFEPGSLEDRVTTMAHASALGALGAKVGAAVGSIVLPGSAPSSAPRSVASRPGWAARTRRASSTKRAALPTAVRTTRSRGPSRRRSRVRRGERSKRCGRSIVRSERAFAWPAPARWSRGRARRSFVV